MAAIEYDPQPQRHIASLHYLDGEKRYILAPAAWLRDSVLAGPEADITPATRCR